MYKKYEPLLWVKHKKWVHPQSIVTKCYRKLSFGVLHKTVPHETSVYAAQYTSLWQFLWNNEDLGHTKSIHALILSFI